jgi:phenylpropionate dioxygenase-like ring-hydroxylating dioxygenase large terminal subunit
MPIAAPTTRTNRTSGRALPLARYSDRAGFDVEVDRLFRHEWLLVGRADAVSAPGDYLALDIVDEPIIVIRDDAGNLRCFSRLCTHRNLPLVDEGAGRLSRFTCGYHLWSFRLDGSLIGAPLTSELEDFDAAACGLSELPVTEWLGFVFVSLDVDIDPFEERVRAITAALDQYHLDAMRSIAECDEVWPVNWKLGVENASESYHHAGTHGETVGPYAPPIGSTVEVGTEHWALHRTAIRTQPDNRGPDDLISLDDGERAAFRCYTIFPSTVILVWRGSCNWLSFLPVAPDQTRLIAGMVYPAELATGSEWAEARAEIERRFDVVNSEDKEMLARLQAVSRARLGRQGPLLPQEGALAQLYEYLDRAMAGA